MSTTSLDQDIQRLHEDHGVSPLLTQSLKANPKEARECIRFFKQMMYVFHGGLITLGFVFVWYGLTHHSKLGYVLILIGGALVIRFALVLIRQTSAVQEMERVCKKHSLM